MMVRPVALMPSALIPHIQEGGLVDCSIAVAPGYCESRRRTTRATTSGKSRTAGDGSSQAKTADADDPRQDRKQSIGERVPAIILEWTLRGRAKNGAT